MKSLKEMREALAAICDEGLGKRIDRHFDNSKRLQDGILNYIGLDLFVEREEYRLPTTVTVKLPKRIKKKPFVKYLAER